jgi:hypothetical protein
VIGRVGGPYEFNLRDFAKLRDVIAGSAADQLYHYKFYKEDDKSKEANSNDANIRILYLCKFAVRTRTTFLFPFLILINL